MDRNNGNKVNKNLIYVIAFVLITVISLFYKLFLSGTFDGFLGSKNDSDPVVVRSQETEASEALTTTAQTDADIVYETESLISVYICGEVNNPGVYEVSAGSIVNDVLMLADGFTENAATDRINLVYIIESNVSIYIPSVDEEYSQGEIIRSDGETIWGETSSEVSSVSTGLVNINTASREQLMTLPGIGEVTADAIIDYRETNTFERIEDIMNVTGIGESKFNNIRELICV